jgi:hypothetical protein
MAKEKKYKKNLITFYTVSLIATVIALILLFVPPFKESPSTSTASQTTSALYGRWNCGDLQINVNSVEEAIGYYKYGVKKPAIENFKFEIMDITVINKATVTKDISGYRILLLAGNSSYIPIAISQIEKIALLDNSVVDYSCDELKMSSISRIELEAGKSSRGCKAFQIPINSRPASISVYDVESLKCTIKI